MKDKIKFIKEIASNMNENKIEKLKYEDSNFEIELNKKMRKSTSVFNYIPTNIPNSSFAMNQMGQGERKDKELVIPVENVESSLNEEEIKGIKIESPMVGTFYSSPSPDSEPFIKEGDRVSEGQTLCIVEAMKLMNEVKSTVSGKIVKIMAKNGDIIKKGQVLVIIE